MILVFVDLQAQKSSMRFSLNVPGKGQVDGVLHYFPFENASESLPVEDYNLVHNPISNFNMTQPQPNLAYTQAPPTTQATTQAMKGGHTQPNVSSFWILFWGVMMRFVVLAVCSRTWQTRRFWMLEQWGR